MTKRTIPSSQSIAHLVDPMVRDYVDARIREELAEIHLSLGRMQDQLRSLTNRMSGWSGNVHARVNALEDAIKLTPASRRKMEQMVELLKEVGE